ncbi:MULTISPECIES: monovalent cation/H+ antiporter complex subunit F [unclassified Streptomyces]|uniref:monovalent cation/H+ antiporter complex subunit F n=1 Tax=unclassified Streptomyces TaxID=2593676 RepID=UPI0010101814|nr:monovalent cation/H+ antiporter complex subunit F [Streptomyces sp. L2]
MNAWQIGALALLAGGFPPAALLAVRGEPVDRLIGLEIGGAVAVLFLLLLIQGLEQPSYLIVPLVMVLVSFAGTLVFTRLLAPPAEDS